MVSFRDETPMPTCAGPGCTFPVPQPATGRPARYCSPACRGRAHGQRRRDHDVPEAKGLLAEALACCEDLDARAWAARTGAALRRLGVHPGDSGTTATAGRDLSRLVAEGLTNREVAKRLHISPHTLNSEHPSATRVRETLRVEPGRAGSDRGAILRAGDLTITSLDRVMSSATARFHTQAMTSDRPKAWSTCRP